MSKEKIIKKQAREALKGNIVPIIAGIAAVCLVVILLENLFYWFTIMFGAIDLETETLNSGSELVYYAVLLSAVALGMMLSPLLNGVLKAAGNTAVYKKCEVTDVFYFFAGFRRYLKTLIVNLWLALIFTVLSYAFDFYGYARYFIDDSTLERSAAAHIALAVAFAVSVIFKILIYMIFVHYPLAAYALDDGKSAFKYVFGYIGFSFSHLGALLKLFFSLFGWLALCFFVVPALYAAPYAAVSAMNSARWLLKTGS